MEKVWKNEGATRRKRFDHFKPGRRLDKPNLVAIGCHRLPPKSHGKEGVRRFESVRGLRWLACCALRAVVLFARQAGVGKSAITRAWSETAFTLVVGGSFISRLYSGDSTATSATLPSASL